MEITYRPATPDDFEYLYRLNKATMRVYAEQTYGPWEEEGARRYFAERFDPASTRILLIDGHEAGMLQVVPRDGYVHLMNVRVAPEHQGCGIGTRLIADVLRDAHGAGLSVRLRVLKVNPARRLYERLGFAVIEDDGHFYVMEAHPSD